MSTEEIEIGDETGTAIAVVTVEQLEKFHGFGVNLPRGLCPGVEHISVLLETQKIIDLIKKFKGDIVRVLELLELSE